MITGVQVLILTIIFVLPGLMLSWVVATFAPRPQSDAKLAILQYITISIALDAPWILGLFLAFRHNLRSESDLVQLVLARPAFTSLLAVLAVFVVPAVVGALVVINDRTGLGSKLALRIGLSPLSPIDTAWDHKFHRLRFGGTSWILVTLKDNSRVAGKYVDPSMASTHEGDRDLYIDSVYVIDQNGGWKPAPRNPSILIRGDQIKTVEFFENG